MFRCLALSLATLLVTGSPAVAAPGDLDPAFGIGGQRAFQVAGEGAGFIGRLRVAANGKLSALFGPTTIHFAADGSVEESSTVPSISWASARQADGKVLLANNRFNGLSWEAKLERRNPDGSLDSSFGLGGIASVATYEQIEAVTPLAGGKTALLLKTQLGGSWVARQLDERGAADSSFGTAGRVLIGSLSEGLYYGTLVPRGERELLAVGTLGSKRLVVARVFDGAKDETFGQGGWLVSPGIGGPTESLAVRDVLLRPDGRQVVVATTIAAVPAGLGCYPAPGSAVLFGFDARGRPDPFLGAEGIVAIQVQRKSTHVSGAALDEEGRILLGGQLWDGECSFASFIARMTELGEPDLAFGDAGVRILTGQVEDVVTVPADRIVAVTRSNSPDPHALVMLIGGGASPDSDGDGIPDATEASLALNPRARDNDVFADARLFAMQQYRDFLGREGDTAGVTHWGGRLTDGNESRAQVIETFFDSAEFQSLAAPIARLYYATFLRIPDYGGLIHWIGRYGGGDSLEVIANLFATSPELVATYGALDNAGFVDRVYRNVLGRAPDRDGLAFWKAGLDSGMTRGQMMVAFSESPEYRALIANEVYVTMTYVGMLRRAPDPSGFSYWVSYIDAGNSGLALIEGFLAAPEYRSRFLP